MVWKPRPSNERLGDGPPRCGRGDSGPDDDLNIFMNRDSQSSALRHSFAESLRALGLENTPVAYVTGNFSNPGRFGLPKQDVLATHFESLVHEVGVGTIVVPTHSWSVLGHGASFDPRNTSSETGAFTEYVRKIPGTRRQHHALSSVAAHGPQAEGLLSGLSRHAYGPGSPWEKMLEAGAQFVSVGMPLEHSISLVHHVEFLAGVPYRYTKVFTVPVVQSSGQVLDEDFFLNVVYRGLDAARDKNRRIFARLRQLGLVQSTSLGQSFVEMIAFESFVEVVLDMMLKNPYVWLAERPLRLGKLTEGR